MSTEARHGRLPRRRAVGAVVTIAAMALGIGVVSAGSVAAIALQQIRNEIGGGTDITPEGEAPPTVGPITGPVNILLVGSDSGQGNPAYGRRGENLNDVTILLHISPVSHTATAVSFPRDMYTPISGCESNPGTRKINEALTYGGLACAVSTVSALTGLQIDYAAKIEFDGVIAMSNAVGGVDVCVATAIQDSQISFDLAAGQHTLQGYQALQFLRSRYGVGDGSDTGRIGNQQLFLSALMRKVKSEETLTNPVTVYQLAQAAAQNMELSTSLTSLDTMASMALAVKDIPLANIAFVQYPTGSTTINGVGGLLPRRDPAKVLTDALAADSQIVITGTTGGGAVAGEDIVETATPAPTDTAAPAPAVDPSAPAMVELPSSITGQPATEQTCTAGQNY